MASIRDRDSKRVNYPRPRQLKLEFTLQALPALCRTFGILYDTALVMDINARSPIEQMKHFVRRDMPTRDLAEGTNRGKALLPWQAGMTDWDSWKNYSHGLRPGRDIHNESVC